MLLIQPVHDVWKHKGSLFLMPCLCTYMSMVVLVCDEANGRSPMMYHHQPLNPALDIIRVAVVIHSPNHFSGVKLQKIEPPSPPPSPATSPLVELDASGATQDAPPTPVPPASANSPTLELILPDALDASVSSTSSPSAPPQPDSPTTTSPSSPPPQPDSPTTTRSSPKQGKDKAHEEDGGKSISVSDENGTPTRPLTTRESSSQRVEPKSKVEKGSADDKVDLLVVPTPTHRLSAPPEASKRRKILAPLSQVDVEAPVLDPPREKAPEPPSWPHPI